MKRCPFRARFTLLACLVAMFAVTPLPAGAANPAARGDAKADAAVVAALLAIPDYQQEFAADDPRLAPYRHKVLNAIDFGAKADGKSHPLRESFASQAAIDAKYGAGHYTLEDEADFVAIMEMIRIAKGCGEYIPSTRAVKYTNNIYLPVGTYIINRTIFLTDTIGGTFRGDGRFETIIRFNAAGPLFAVSRCAFLSFKEFAIESTIASHSTGFFFSNPPDQRYGKPTFNMTFDSMFFQRLFKGIQITGHVMTDSMVFSNTRFLQCITSFQLQNPQGLNYQFMSCNFEVHGTPASFAPYTAEDVVIFHIQAGGDITVLGGNIIHSGVTLLLEPDMAFSPDGGRSPSISWGSGIYNFYGVRWEQSGGTRPVLFDAKDDGRYVARINFDNSQIYQMIASRGKPVGKLHNGLNVSFRNSVFNAGSIQEVLTPGQENRKSTLILDNTSGLKYEPAVPEPGTTTPYRHVFKDRDAVAP